MLKEYNIQVGETTVTIPTSEFFSVMTEIGVEAYNICEHLVRAIGVSYLLKCKDCAKSYLAHLPEQPHSCRIRKW